MGSTPSSIDATTNHRAMSAAPTDLLAASGVMSVAFTRLFSEWLRGLTTTVPERLALAHLWDHGDMQMSELARRIPLSRAAVTALVDRLTARDLVARVADTLDRRRTTLTLTPRARSLIGGLVTRMEQDAATVNDHFSEDELDVVGRWMSRARARFHEHSEQLALRTDEEIQAATR